MTILLEIALKSFVVFAVAGLASLLLRRAAASTRHLVWSLATITVLFLPAAVVLGPRQTVTVADDGLLARLDLSTAPESESGPVGSETEPSSSTTVPRTTVEPPTSTTAERTGVASRTSEAARQIEAPSAGPARHDTVTGESTGRSEVGAATTPRPDRETHFGVTLPVRSDTMIPVESGVTAMVENGVASAAGRISIASLSLVIWLGGTALVLLTLMIERLRVGCLARRARECRAGPLAEAFHGVCRDAGLRRRPRLFLGAPGAMPMTWGTLRPVILLPAEAEQWASARLHAVLRHELAHVRRFDDLTQILATIAAALHWFDPLAWLALRRLRVEREFACDDAVLRFGARPSSYAEELLGIVDEFRHPVAAGLAAQSMARRAQLHHRLRAVLDPSRNRQALTPRRVLGGTVVAALVAAPLAALALVAAPGVAETGSVSTGNGAAPVPPSSSEELSREEPAPRLSSEEPTSSAEAEPAAGAATSLAAQVSECWSPGVDRSSRSTTDTDSNLRILEWESAGCRADLRLQGNLVFNRDFTEVVGISPGGSFLLEHDEDGVTRRLELVAGAGGAPEWTWLVDGREQPYDAEAQRWFAELLVSILRSSGIAAEERTAWIYQERGARGVFDEVGLMPSDSTRSRYLQALLRLDGLDAADLEEVIRVVRIDIDSNSAKGRVLETLGTRYPQQIVDGPLDTAYWEAVAGIDSNSTTMGLLVDLVEGQPQSSPLVTRAIRAAAANIDSNSTLSSFLRRLQRRYPGIATSGPQTAPFWETVAHIDSDSTMRGFLLDIGDGVSVDDAELLPLIFDTAQASISSNSTLADFVRSMERRYPGIGESGPMRDEFWETVGGVDSSSTLSELLLDLASGKADDSAMLDRVLDEAGRIDSSSQKGRFLVSFARQHPDAASGRLQDRLLEAARGIDSRSGRERTLRSLQEMGIG